MKVIEDNYHQLKNFTCWKCGSILQIGFNDITKNAEGQSIIRCPLCNAENHI